MAQAGSAFSRACSSLVDPWVLPSVDAAECMNQSRPRGRKRGQPASFLLHGACGFFCHRHILLLKVMAEVEQPPHQDQQPDGFFSSTAGTYFADKEALQEHYRSDFHRYNLKRKVAGLPPVTREWFDARKEQLNLAATRGDVSKVRLPSHAWSPRPQQHAPHRTD